MTRLAKLVTVFGLFATAALAAPEATSTMPETPNVGSGSAAPPTMTVEEMNVSVAQLQARIDDDGTQMTRLQELAKKQKDVIKLNCVNDRLVESKAQRNIADDIHTQLTAAIQKNSDERQALYQQYVVSSEKVKELREQAKSCIGAPELYKQEAGVTVEAPDIPDDPTIMNPPTETIEPPGYASPFD